MINKDLIAKRSQLYKNIRNFFDKRGYLEVETPIMSADLIPEPTIENFSTTFTNEFIGSKELYLVPSPEVFMKKLIAEGSGSIYQISKCFRNAEQIGKLHNPEFTMLEYYTMDFDEQDSIGLTEQLFKESAIEGCPEALKKGFERITVDEALFKSTGLRLLDIQNYKSLREACDKLGLYLPQNQKESWDDTFNRIFINFVEPSLVSERPIVLTDYPRQIECLALNNGITKKRWELYYKGVEIANCYAEETNEDVVASYYQKEYAILAQQRAQSGSVIPDCDTEYHTYFKNFPKCSGVAIGLDRLLMVECSKTSIDDLILFDFSVIL